MMDKKIYEENIDLSRLLKPQTKMYQTWEVLVWGVNRNEKAILRELGL